MCASNMSFLFVLCPTGTLELSVLEAVRAPLGYDPTGGGTERLCLVGLAGGRAGFPAQMYLEAQWEACVHPPCACYIQLLPGVAHPAPAQRASSRVLGSQCTSFVLMYQWVHLGQAPGEAVLIYKVSSWEGCGLHCVHLCGKMGPGGHLVGDTCVISLLAQCFLHHPCGSHGNRNTKLHFLCLHRRSVDIE